MTRIGLPKLWTPEAEGSVGGPVRFTARLSTALPWRVEVRDAAGSIVDSHTGNGTVVDWTWDATAVPIASYTYTISAGPNVRPSTLPVPGPPPLAVTHLKASPRAVTPNGDWSGERTSIRFGLNRRALLGVRVVSLSTGSSVRTLLASSTRSAGPRSVSWDGRTTGGSPVPDGRYRIEVTAEAGVEHVTRSIRVVVDRTLGGVVRVAEGRLAERRRGSRRARDRLHAHPRGDGSRSDQATAAMFFARFSTGRRGQGLTRPAWNGRAHGTHVPDGDATAVVSATTSLGTRRLSRSLEVDTRAPVVRVLSLRTVKGVMRLRVQLSEPAELRVWHGRETWNDGGSFVVMRPAGAVWIRRPLQATKVVRILATDDGPNRGAAVVYRARRR